MSQNLANRCRRGTVRRVTQRVTEVPGVCVYQELRIEDGLNAVSNEGPILIT